MPGQYGAAQQAVALIPLVMQSQHAWVLAAAHLAQAGVRGAAF